MKMKSKLNIYYISLILNAFATLAPDNQRYLSELGPELHDRLAAAVNTETFRIQKAKDGEVINMVLKVEELIPDLTAFSNLWLSIACFGIKSPL